MRQRAVSSVRYSGVTAGLAPRHGESRIADCGTTIGLSISPGEAAACHEFSPSNKC